jgi:hypothetical protein
VPFKDIVATGRDLGGGLTEESRAQFTGIIDQLPLAYSNVPAIFRSPSRSRPGRRVVLDLRQ